MEPNVIQPKTCVYCLEPIRAEQPRQWLGIRTYAHRDCYDAVATDHARQNGMRRFA
jgi:hypothetical protein